MIAEVEDEFYGADRKQDVINYKHSKDTGLRYR